MLLMAFIPGLARHLISFERKVMDRDQFGQDATGWVPHLDARAIARPKAPREVFEEDQTYHTVQYEFELRYRSTLMRDDLRIVWQGQYFKILGMVNPAENRRDLIVTAEKTREVSAQ